MTGIFIHLQVKRTVLGPVDRGSPVSGPRSRFLNFNFHRLYKLNKRVFGDSILLNLLNSLTAEVRVRPGFVPGQSMWDL